MKGSRHASDQYESEDQRLRDETLIYWGRQQSDLEHYASAKALDPMAFAARLGELWLLYARQRDGDRMPLLSSGGNHVAARKRGRPVAAAKSRDGAHDDGARPRKKAPATGNPAPDKVKRRDTWAKFKTPAARRKEAKRRMLMRKDPLAKAMLQSKALKGVKAGPKKNQGRRPNMAKQKIYAARHAAKLKGEPIPPLPGEVQAA